MTFTAADWTPEEQITWEGEREGGMEGERGSSVDFIHK